MPTDTLFPLIIGVAMLAAPVYFWPEWRKGQRRTEIVMGKVVGHEEQTVETHMGSGRAKTDHAAIEFEVDGQTHTFVASEGASWQIHPPGSEQWVCYDPEDPANADVLPGPITKIVHFLGLLVLPIAGLVILLRAIS